MHGIPFPAKYKVLEPSFGRPRSNIVCFFFTFWIKAKRMPNLERVWALVQRPGNTRITWISTSVRKRWRFGTVQIRTRYQPADTRDFVEFYRRPQIPYG